MELQAVTGQLYIIDGVVQQRNPETAPVPGLLAQAPPHRPAHSRERDMLFVHLTLTGQLTDTAVLHQDLLKILSRHFYKTSGSVTAAMRSAILEANRYLLHKNISQSGLAHEGAITCCAFRQEELFTLQAGESLALLGHNFGIESLPPQEPAHITPLGRSQGLDIRYYHHRLHSGDMLLLADPRISHLGTEALAPALVDTQIEDGLETLVRIVGADSARLLLVEFGEDVPLTVPEISAPLPQSNLPAAAAPQPRREPGAVPLPVSPERRPQPERPSPRRTLPENPAANMALPAVDREKVERTARQAGAKAALGAANFTEWLAELLSRLRPYQAEEDEEPINWLVPGLMAVLIPLLVGAIITSVYVERGQMQRLAEIRSEMSQYIGQADGAGEADARLLYNNVLALADEANTQLRPGDEQVAQMQAVARSRLDELDGITRLTPSIFYQYQTEGTTLTNVTLQEGFTGGVYTLDQANGLVYKHDTDSTYVNQISAGPLQLSYEGQVIGNHVVGGVLDMIWRPEGDAVDIAGLAMLDTNGALLTFQPSYDNTFAVPLDLASEWRIPTDITTFDERLYILDRGAAVIWKYFPNGNDFIANAEDRTVAFTDNPELDKAVDFDIFAGDGSLLLLYEDGRIRYYDTRSGRLQWNETDVQAHGLNVPLKNPVSARIIGRGLNASIFIADAGNGRIVQVSRPTGQVLAQYRATAADGTELFSGIANFDVAESPLRIFVVKGNTVYVAVLE